MTRWLAILFLLLSSSVAHGAATYATLSGTVLDNDGSPCVSCNVTIRTAATQVVGGETFPEESFGVTHVTDADGDLPAGVFVARTLIVGISLANDPNEVRVRIPDQASVNIGDLILPPVAPPVGCTGCIVSANIATGAVTASKIGATDAPADEECLTYESTGPTLEWQTCGSGGGSSNSFETWDTPAGTDIVADSATDTVQFLASGIVSITGGGAADTITIGATEVGDITDVGDCTGPACFNGTTGNSLQFEGSTADGFETTLTATDPTADRTATLPNFTGTVALERVYDVRAYGALCNDSNDDTAEIQAAIDAAEATGQGGVIQLPVGICIITALTINEPGITLRGQGAATSNNGTVLSCNITTGTCVSLGSSCSYCGLQDLAIATRNAPTDAVLIDGTDAPDDFVRQVNSIGQRYCTAIKNVRVVDRAALFTPIAGASCRAVSVVDNAAFLRHVSVNLSTNVEGAIVIEQTAAGQVDTVVMTDVEVATSGGTGAGLKIMGTSAVNPPRWIQVSNSLFEAKTTGAASGDYAIQITNAREFKCTNCYAHGGYNAVNISGGPGPIRFVNSEIGDSQREALVHNADVPTELIGTTVSDGSQSSSNTYAGIQLGASSRQFTMIGGRASDDLFFSGTGQKYGIEIISGADEYRFDNVGCEGNDTACAVGLSTATTQAAFTDGTAYADSDWSNYVLMRAPTLSANVTATLPNFTGTVAMERVYDVRAYGAVCDGATNDATAIQAAIDAANTRGGIVQFPEGTCRCTAALNLDDYEGIILQGQGGRQTTTSGTILDFNITGSGSLLSAKSISGLTIRDMAVRTVHASFTGKLIDVSQSASVTDATFITLDNVYVIDTGGGVRSSTLLYLDKAHTIQVQNSRFENGGYAIYGKASSGSYSNVVNVNGTYFANQDTAPIWNPGDSWSIIGNTFQQTAGSTSVGIGHDSGVNGRGQIIAGNIFNDSTTGTSSWITTASSGVNITGNLLAGHAAGSEVGVTIDATTFSGVIDGNTFVNLGTGIDCTTGTVGYRIGNNTFTSVTTSLNSDCDGASNGSVQTDLNRVENAASSSYVNVDSDNGGTGAAFILGHNGVGTGATKLFEVNENGNATLYKGVDLQLYDADNSNYVQQSVPALAANWTLTWPATDGATGDLLYNTDGNGTLGWRTPNAGTDITADLEEETHATEHSLGGTDAITVTNLASACSDGQVLGGTAAGTGVECQADVDTNTNASTICAGTTTYLDGEGNCDDISSVYLPLAGGTMSGGILLNSSVTGSTGSSFDLLDFSNTFDMTAGAPQTINGLDFSPTATMSTAGNPELNAVKFGGSVAVSTTVPFVHGLYFTPTVSYSNTTDPFPVYRVSAATCSPTFTSSSSNATLYQDCFADLTTVNYSGATDVTADVSTGNPWAPWTVLSSQTFKTTAAGDLTIGRGGNARFQPTFDAENASSVLTFTNLVGYDAVTPACTSDNCGSGSVAIDNWTLAWADFSTALDTGSSITNAYGLRLTDFTRATNNWSLYSNGNTTLYNGGVADLGDAIADVTTNTTNVVDISPTVDITGTGTVRGVYVAPATTNSSGSSGQIYGVEIAPTLSSNSIDTLGGVRMAGTVTQTAKVATLYAGGSYILDHGTTYTSSTADVQPREAVYGLYNHHTLSHSATSGSATTPNNIGVVHAPTISKTGAGSFTVTNDTAVEVQGTYTESAGTLTISNRRGLWFRDVTNTSSAASIPVNVGVDIAALSAGTTNIGIRNADTTVFTAGTQAIAAAGNTITCTATTLHFTTATGTTVMTSNPTVADGTSGQVCILINTDATGTDCITLESDGTLGLRLSGDRTLCPNDTITLYYNGTDWLELAYSNAT